MDKSKAPIFANEESFLLASQVQEKTTVTRLNLNVEIYHALYDFETAA